MSTRLSPLRAYEFALHSEGWHAATDDGRRVGVDTRRWRGGVTDADVRLLARAQQPVLDVGCGPGRHAGHLIGRGVAALGVDVSAAAVALARDRGVSVVHGSIFGAIPDPGLWGSALLLDGNIGIGGDPVALLTRLRSLLVPAGTALIECVEPTGRAMQAHVRLVGPAGSSTPFPWGFLDHTHLPAVAAQAGYAVTEVWRDDGRWFAEVRAV